LEGRHFAGLSMRWGVDQTTSLALAREKLFFTTGTFRNQPRSFGEKENKKLAATKGTHDSLN